VVVEKKLLASRGLSRHELGREQFLAEVAVWQAEKGGRILDQLCELGASLDWSRAQSTLSPAFRAAVDTAFIRLFEQGLIYRSEQQLVNWCPDLQSAISDIEVDHVKVEGRTEVEVPGYDQLVTFGVMTNIAYQVVGDDGLEVVVGTTRPETMLGDTAVAVHPSDPRYAHLHGRTVWHPFRAEAIPIVTDEQVEPELGTGALKITPAHDRADWAVGARHGLDRLQVFDTAGRVGPDWGQFAGQHRFEARGTVCQALAGLGLLRDELDHPMTIPVCSRTGDVVEPMIRPQWFLATGRLAELAERAVRDGDLVLEPQHHRATWAAFMGEASRDWCLSRQIWWGHQVPAYSCALGPRTCWVAAASEVEARGKAAVQLGLGPGEEEALLVTRDEDVLDTWFSSGLYPFAALGWPEETADLERFYPLDLMETGHDILFFWVGRMVMLGIALTSKLPFTEVLLHGVVTDPEGRKMSKSLGNVVDPMHLIHGASLLELEAGLQQSAADGYLADEELAAASSGLRAQWPEGIPAHGADPLRWAIATYDVKAQQVRLEPQVLQAAGAWCNKVWQLGRVLHQAHARAAGRDLAPGKDFQPGLMDMWILSQLAVTVDRVNKHFEARDLHLVTRELRSFVYTDLCDTYVEYVKPRLADPDSPEFLPSLLILHSCVLSALKLLHPLVPFLTEELFHRLPTLPAERRKESLMVESFPLAVQWNGFLNPALGQTVAAALQLVTALRHMKATYQLRKDVLPTVLICTKLQELQQLDDLIQGAGRCGELFWSEETVEAASLPQGYIRHEVEGAVLFMDVGKHIDFEKEMKKIKDKLAKVERDRQKIIKSTKGKYKFRISPEVAVEKQKELDGVVAVLEEQVEMIHRLKSNSDVAAESS
jgi:valyl-tRNA synthetase